MTTEIYTLTPKPVQGIQWSGDNTEEVIAWLKSHNVTPSYFPSRQETIEYSYGRFFNRRKATKQYETIPYISYEGYSEEMRSKCFYNLYVNDIAIFTQKNTLSKINRNDVDKYCIVVDI